MQDTEEWPVYYESARSVFERQQLINPPDDVVEAYFQFRDVFREMAQRLGVNSWTLEQLCQRLAGEQATESTGPVPETIAAESTALANPLVIAAEVSGAVSDADVAGHAHVQWLLATLGRQLGCQVWIATNDRSRMHNGIALGSLSLDALPRMGLGDDVSRRLSYVDVLWLKGSRVTAAFEVEHTTSIYSGLLRLSDLVAAAPNLNFRLYIVTPEDRIRFVEAELRRPTFQTLDLHKRCGFFSEDALLKAHEGLMQWASDPFVIEKKLARYVADVDAD
jgi:hypothetical protein